MKRLGTDGLLCCSEMGNIAPPGGTKNPRPFMAGSLREV